MKHLLLVIVCAVIAYAIWATSSKIERRHAARMLTRHGLALGAIIAVILAIAAAAYHLSSTPIL